MNKECDCMPTPCPKCENNDCEMLGYNVWSRKEGSKWQMYCFKCNYQSEPFDTEQEMLERVEEVREGQRRW